MPGNALAHDKEKASRENGMIIFVALNFISYVYCTHYDTLYLSVVCLVSNVMHACISATVDSPFFAVQFIVRLILRLAR